MPKKNHKQPDADVERNKEEKDPQRGLWIIIGVSIALLLLVVIVGSFVITSQKVRFITEFSLTVAVAALVGVQTYIYRKQWEVMKEQSMELGRQTEQTGQSFRTARRHATYTLRAYVNIHTSFVTFPTTVSFRIVNFGQTPAHDFEFAAMIAVRDANDFPEADVKSAPWLDAWLSKGVPLAPTMAFNQEVQINPVSDEEDALIKEGARRLFCWGAIRYKDIFRRTRYTRFSGYHVTGTNKLAACPIGNDAT